MTKRNAWLVSLLLGALCGLGSVAWSRSGEESPKATSEPSAEKTDTCASKEGGACSCSTGLDRASLMKAKPKPGAQD